MTRTLVPIDEVMAMRPSMAYLDTPGAAPKLAKGASGKEELQPLSVRQPILTPPPPAPARAYKRLPHSFVYLL